MANFLEVGSMRENLQEVLERAQQLRRLLSMTTDQRAAMEQARVQQGDLTTHAEEVRNALAAILGLSEEMIGLLDRFESAPIMFTGEGSTAEVLAMLERLYATQRSDRKG